MQMFSKKAKNLFTLFQIGLKYIIKIMSYELVVNCEAIDEIIFPRDNDK